MKNIPVVDEFSDVFPDEIHGLPPERKVEFEIKLLTSTAHISRVSHRLAPSEMKKLKKQLQDLLDKGYSRPSVSPWEHQCCSLRKRMGMNVFS